MLRRTRYAASELGNGHSQVCPTGEWNHSTLLDRIVCMKVNLTSLIRIEVSVIFHVPSKLMWRR